MISMFEYSYFPLERILDQHRRTSNPVFRDVSFNYQTTKFQHSEEQVMLGDSCLHPILLENERTIEKDTISRDFSVAIHHNLHCNQLSCTITASLNLFKIETVHIIAQRFHLILRQLFYRTVDVQMRRSISEFSSISSEENLLLQSINNTNVLPSSSHSSIHHLFVDQVIKHPQMISVELDDQSVTYAETLTFCSTLISNTLQSLWCE